MSQKEELDWEAVQERDVDLLVFELFKTNDEFTAEFLQFIGEQGTESSILHSVSETDLGESDLILSFNNDGKRVAALIENKVNAPPQKIQAKRYKKRGTKGIKEGNWERYTTCLLAPEKYIEAGNMSDEYKHRVSYEKIREIVLSMNSIEERRKNFLVEFINQGIEKQRRSGSGEHNEKTTAFWQSYFAKLDTDFEELKMEFPMSRGPGSTFLEMKYGGHKITHKLDKGYVDLAIPVADKTEAENLVVRLGFDKDKNFYFTKKTYYMRFEVQKLDVQKKFKDQIQAVHEGMKNAYKFVPLIPVIDKLLKE